MYSTEAYPSPTIEAYSERTAPNTERTYTAKEIANEHSVTDATVRNRWFKWLLKVAPEQLLKEGKAYTVLAHTLFSEFAQVDVKERDAWVVDTKQYYAAEFGSAGVIDCEVMPDTVGSALALLSTNNLALQQSIELELAEVTDFVEKLNAADENYSQGEVEQWIATGKQRAIAQFKTEEVIKAQTLNALRQQRLQGGKS